MPGKPFEPLLCRTREASQQNAEDAQKFLASIVEHSEDAIVGCTPDGMIVSWNQAAQKLFGYSAEEIIGKNLAALPIDEAIPTVNAVIQRMKRGKPYFPLKAVA